MSRLALGTLLLLIGLNAVAGSDGQLPAAGRYLFARAGDVAKEGNDFLAVIDADPHSPTYAHLIATVATDQPTMRIHHTEYTMPASGMLFANDHEAGRTFMFDVCDGLHPRIITSFTDVAGYSHPHSYLRLPNGHVLATFQHLHHSASEAHNARTGALIEIDDQGRGDSRQQQRGSRVSRGAADALRPRGPSGDRSGRVHQLLHARARDHERRYLPDVAGRS